MHARHIILSCYVYMSVCLIVRETTQNKMYAIFANSNRNLADSIFILFVGFACDIVIFCFPFHFSFSIFLFLSEFG